MGTILAANAGTFTVTCLDAHVELATLEWVSWLDHHRLMEPIGYSAPAEAEANYHRQLASQPIPV